MTTRPNLQAQESLMIDERAFASVEWVLLIGGVILPMAALIYSVMNALSRYYSLTSWIVSLPFP